MLLVWGLGFEEFHLAKPQKSSLTRVPGNGSTPVAVQSKTCHVQDAEQHKPKKWRSKWFAGLCRERTPLRGEGRTFGGGLCCRINAGGGVGCQSASPPAEGRFGA